MFISYKHQENIYCLLTDWTSADGRSSVFREVTKKVADRHGFSPDKYQEFAEHLDALTDKLYEQVFGFIDEYYGIPYDPRFRKRISQSLSELTVSVRSYSELCREEHERLLSDLYGITTDKLRETVAVYLEEHAYRSKYRERMRDSEQYIETTAPAQLSFEFEDVLIQMTEISRQMDCLSEAERRMLVKHVFLKFTFREIAEQEGVSKSKVHNCVSAALKKIKERLE
jgi:predicted DNA-binding protein (UPF0251 family)